MISYPRYEHPEIPACIHVGLIFERVETARAFVYKYAPGGEMRYQFSDSTFEYRNGLLIFTFCKAYNTSLVRGERFHAIFSSPEVRASEWYRDECRFKRSYADFAWDANTMAIS